MDTNVLKRNLLDALERECKPHLEPASAEPVRAATDHAKIVAFGAFDDLMASTDRESLEFTYDARNGLRIATTRSELRRLAAIVSSAQMDLTALAKQIADKIATAAQ